MQNCAAFSPSSPWNRSVLACPVPISINGVVLRTIRAVLKSEAVRMHSSSGMAHSNWEADKIAAKALELLGVNKEHVTASNESSPEEDGMEARLSDFYQSGLSLDDETTKEALRLFRETKHILLAMFAAPGSVNVIDARGARIVRAGAVIKPCLQNPGLNEKSKLTNSCTLLYSPLP